ncbi:MAG: ParB/RepB/Spo0J family partition protein [Candidatus Saccharimonadales bacterium]
MASKKGLGRGFSSLIPTELLDESFDPTAAQDEQVSELRHIKISEISADPQQPRRVFDDESLAEMAASIKEHGILQPIVVTPYASGYQIVAGERRYRASQLAGLDKIPALVRTLSNQHKLELSLIENLQRRDLNILETATAYLKLRDQFNLSMEEIGKRVGGKSQSTISNTLRLLRLPETVRQALAEGRIREGQARPLINLDPATIEHVLPRILQEEWSARKIEQFVVDLKKGQQTPVVTAKKLPLVSHDNDIKRLEKHLGTAIDIRTNAKGSGKIVISFKDENELKRLEQILER